MGEFNSRVEKWVWYALVALAVAGVATCWILERLDLARGLLGLIKAVPPLWAIAIVGALLLFLLLLWFLEREE